MAVRGTVKTPAVEKPERTRLVPVSVCFTEPQADWLYRKARAKGLSASECMRFLMDRLITGEVTS